VKANRLGDVRSTIDGARKMGAMKYAPQSLENAEAKYKNADLIIETDRHNDQLVTAASDDAMKEAMKLVKVTEIARREKLQGRENVALDLYNKEQNISALNQQKATAEQQARLLQEQNRMQQQSLQNQNQQRQTASQAQLSEAEKKAAMATAALDSQKRLEKVYSDAQKMFSPDEAEVYRQGDNLILRMKGVQFPSGRTEVPSTSYSSLNKAKEVIKELNAEKVIVEGHTDSVGKAATNKKLSQSRAESVAKFIQDPEIPSEQIEARGYGFERPLKTNKTKEGRAQNRRVDIVIEPETSSSDTMIQ
jgi:OOP family OmpA-OmpF porin